ncbi:MAG: hydantoinase/oxoprolinase family protein [Burkholderiales bacterium]|nr:MAG: hydantoinase/oxoprolinase family protein [Burkholderiales bacterium]
MIHIGIDIGGTFTDFAVWQGEPAGYASVSTYKLPSTPPDFAEAVCEGLEHLLQRHAIARDARILIVHGTTVGTNAVITRSGPPMALLTTRGFRDILNLARLRLDKPVDLFNRRAPPLVPRSQVHEIDERVLADGSVDRPIDLSEIGRAVALARAAGIGTIGICFLHAFRTPLHEVAAAEHIGRIAPDMDVVASHEVWPQEAEYERAIVTLLNAYVRRSMSEYIGRIERYLAQHLPNATLLITRSNGGSMSAAEACRQPVHTVLSGPAAGVTAACYLGRALDMPELLTMDMGGTSTDMSLIRAGVATTSTDSRVGDFPLIMPVTAIEALGAGGGSLVWTDGPVLKVGPGSAGAVPGPACYGRGGTEPTLTDAYLVCGYLNPTSLLGGRLALSRELAMRAFAPIAERFAGDALLAAESSIEVATSNMLASVLPYLARLGAQPSDLTLLIYGGAGGIHGPLLASELGIGRIVIPRLPSVFCAFGCLVSELRHDSVRSVHGTRLDHRRLREIFDALRAQADQWLEQQARGALEVRAGYRYQADMRYRGQSFQVAVDLPAETVSRGDMHAVARAFHDEHLRLFGHDDRDAAVEIVDLRLTLVGARRIPLAETPVDREAGPRAARVGARPVRFGRAWAQDTPVLRADRLGAGERVPGPAVFEQDDATVVLPPGFTAQIGRFGDILMTRGA